jgi:maltose/moltooligosaccharide transporter
MLDAQKRLSTGFLVLLSLPTAAVGFALSSSVATTTWLLSTRYDLHLENIALIWMMGPLLGLLVQPIVGVLSDRTWFMNGRRRPYLIAGGVAGAASTYAMLHLDSLAATTGLGLLTVAVIVALLADLSTNVTFNPARSLVADLTPEGPARVRGYTWMQTVSGVLGISAYLISIFFGNQALVLVTVAVVAVLTLVPMMLVEEASPAAFSATAAPRIAGTANSGRRASGFASFAALWPMVGFLGYGAFVAFDKLAFDGALAAWAIPLFLAAVLFALLWGIRLVWKGRAAPSPRNRLCTMLLGHGFAWLGVQSMFVMSFFYVRDFVVPAAGASVLADGLYHMASATTSAASGALAAPAAASDTASRILSMGFLLLNLVGAALPVLVLKPLCLRFGKVRVHRGAMGVMSVAYACTAIAPTTEVTYYLGMLLCGIGWASLISIVFAIYSEAIDSREMGVGMGVFNSSLVLPALAVPGLLKVSDALDHHRWMFALFAVCLALSFAFWCAVSERRESGRAGPAA